MAQSRLTTVNEAVAGEALCRDAPLVEYSRNAVSVLGHERTSPASRAELIDDGEVVMSLILVLVVSKTEDDKYTM